MTITSLHILRANEDTADCCFCNDSSKEIPFYANLLTLIDDFHLMQLLSVKGACHYILSSLNMDIVNLLYQKGTQYYISKSSEVDKLKKVLTKAFILISQYNKIQHPRCKSIFEP